MSDDGHDAAAAARAFVSLGSNLGDRLAIMRAVADAMRRGVLPQTVLIATSSIFETRPIGPSTQPYLNAAVLLSTRLSPRLLLAELLELEAVHGRRRTQPWGARTLDLDLLLYVPAGGDHSLRIDRLDLRLPHPELAHRDFALAPLAELDDTVPVYAGQPASALLEALPESQRTILRRLDTPLL